MKKKAIQKKANTQAEKLKQRIKNQNTAIDILKAVSDGQIQHAERQRGEVKEATKVADRAQLKLETLKVKHAKLEDQAKRCLTIINATMELKYSSGSKTCSECGSYHTQPNECEESKLLNILGRHLTDGMDDGSNPNRERRY